MNLESTNNLDSYQYLIKKFKQLQVDTREPNLFDIGIHGYFENPTTEILSFFLDSAQAHEMGDCFFRGLESIIASKFELHNLGSLQNVATEVSTQKGNRIDLLLETDNTVVLIECKIYHSLSNPFDDYSEYGNIIKRSNEQEKTLVKLILCLNGLIDNSLKTDGWIGISYYELVQAIEKQLSEALLNNPYNKWGLFAREFLLHLKELNKMSSIDIKEINFLTESFKDFTKLSSYIYENLIPKIGFKIETDLHNSNIQNFECKKKYGKWFYYEPIIRFSNKNWLTQSDIVLYIRAHDTDLSHHIHLHIDKQSEELVNKFKELLGEDLLYSNSKTWYESNNTLWGISWEFNSFDLEDISKYIVNLMENLNKLELNERPLLVKQV